ncbi:hypothetical protein B0I35DRAFT_439307 [Stachybotrys elegans]|uniref:Uncharacterized protein n=1 Tax=Stachybotrys elegans TaxID=80388 RepID=A0A8K0WNI6_9HYPO|nr:hypothetical protein B0I35DRAFT_439307 [Stachybotrys elegans]
MSRVSRKPTKARRGSDSSLDLSDEDGYSAVEDISDSEDNDEEDVNAVEEENIIQARPTPRPQLFEEDGDDEDEDDDNADYENAIDDDESVWGGISSGVDGSQHSDFYEEAAAFTESVERHVRFNVPSSESDSTESEDDHAEMFPDIFVAQNTLDPAFRREIEHDPDDSSGSGTFWDFHGHYAEQADPFVSEAEEVTEVANASDDETPVATPATQVMTAASTPTATFEEPQELDGYETDGDTTEEDIPEPPVRRKTRRPSVPMSDGSDSDVDMPIKGQRGQPRVGRFNLDKSDKKPIAVLNPLTRKMMIFTPHRRRQLDLSPEQFNIPWRMEDTASPILTNSGNMMLSAMLSSSTFGAAMGPAEAWLIPPEGPDESSSLPSGAEEEDEAEKKLDINDFITWDNDDGSSGDEGENNWEPSSTPMRPSTASSDMDVLGHLNSETVGAFRRNQINQQLIFSNKATQDSLIFSGPYNHTALKGIKSDRFDTAAAPLTPVRRHKKQVSDLTRSPLEAASAKRKASAEVPSNGHKRHRSISDVNYLHI